RLVRTNPPMLVFAFSTTAFKEGRSMNLLYLSRPLALLMAFALLTADVRADLITPDSIPNPPAAVGSAHNAPIPSTSNLVTTQYAGLGLNFNNRGLLMTAITSLDGVRVWAPGTAAAWPAFVKNPPVGIIAYSGQWAGASFVLPGTLKPTTVSSLTVEIVGAP